MVSGFIDGIIKTLIEKVIGKIVDLLIFRKLSFTKVNTTWCYSHYIGENHVKEGGEKRICQVNAMFTAFNGSNKTRVLRDLKLHCVINAIDTPLRLWDINLESWQENYRVEPSSILCFSWQAVVTGHGVSVWLGAPGMITIYQDDSISFYFTYLDELSRTHKIYIESVKSERFPVQQIAA